MCRPIRLEVSGGEISRYLMIATATETLTRASEPTNERESSRRHAGADAIGGGVHLVAFDLVLDIAKSSLEVRARQSGSGSTAPAQMFEPMEPDAHGRRQAALRADAQREGGATGAEPSDRTSVGARREHVRGSAGGGGGSSSATGGVKQAAAFAGGNASALGMSAQQGMTESSPARSDGTHRLDALDASAAREARNHTAKEAQPVVEVPKESFGGMAGAVKVPAAGQQPSSTNGADGVAAKVGQVLGASRVGGSESARAIQAAQPAPDGRTQVDTQRPSSRSTQSERSSGERPSHRTQTDERTRPFDELVRSLRLRPGAYRSSAKMHLNPPELGRLSIDVRMEGERLYVDVRTEHAEAAKLLQERVVQLRAALAEHGIIVERFDVDTQTSEQGDDFEAQDDSSGESTERHAAQRHAVSSEAPGADGMRDGGRGEPGPELDEVVAVAERRLDVRI